MNAARRFPDGFLWGSATSSHQIEGNNRNNDWWEWERAGKTEDLSGAACDSYNRYDEDFDWARRLGHNSHRFSIEWSRIQPRPDEWDARAIDHYRHMIRGLRDRGLEPLVTLHHFTNPSWLAREGGWENPAVVERFRAYVERTVRELGRDVAWWITINEPMVYVFHGYLAGLWPPGRVSARAAMRVTAHMARAHCAAYGSIHRIYREEGRPAPRVGVAKALSVLDPHRPRSFSDRWAVFVRDRVYNRLFLKLIRHSSLYLPAHAFGTGGRRRCLDFIGLNYYFREIIRGEGFSPDLKKAMGRAWRDDERYRRAEKSGLDWEVYPRGIYRALMSLKAYGLPVVITENGICTDDDAQRKTFIHRHLGEVLNAIEAGVDVRGYQHWSLLDNFEWSFGFRPRFGLIHVDFGSQKRTPKDSAAYYSGVCRRNALEDGRH